MKRSIISSARRAAATSGSAASKPQSRQPFICAACKRAAIQNPRATIVQSHRAFSTASRRQQEPLTEAVPPQPPRRESVIPQTHYDYFPSTFPDGPPPKSPFTPDLRQLRKEYLQLQSKSHPDLAPAHQKRHFEAISMRLNEAYKTIQDPLRRARYLLSLRGIDVEDESAQLAENELLMEVMEVREAVEDVENEEDLVEIRKENNERIAASVKLLEDLFARDDVDAAAHEAVRLRYWTNVEESIQGWEKGKGGGLLHH